MPARLRIPKITKPVLAGVCRRPRLFGRMDALSARHRIVWVSASGGSGKTTLATTYLEARRRRCLWYQLDARDADPAAFFYYLREAAGQLAPRRRESLPLLTPEYAFGVDAYAQQFFEKLAQRLPAGAWLVLDNYQDLPEEAPLQALLPVALAALPATTRVLVLSRAEPPPQFARLMTESAIGYLDGEELGLTTNETRALAQARMGRRIGAEVAIALRGTSGGWVAGTVLLLEADRALPRRRGTETRVQQVLFDYFASEIFDRASPEAQRLLLATALLPEIDVSAAEALAGEPLAGQILADLVRRNFFTLRLDGVRPRYRLHPLFREFLLARARRTLEPAAWRALARQAADLLAGSGDADAAASILIEAGCEVELAGLVCAHAPALAAQGRLASLDAWLRALPCALVESTPWVSYWAGMCRLATPDEARDHLERAYRAFRQSADTAGALIAWAGYVNTFFYVWTEFGPLDRWIAEMEELRQTAPAFPSADVETQVAFGMLASLMWRDPGHPEVEHWVARAEAMLDADVRPESRMQLAAYLVFHRVWWKGDRRAAALLARMRPFVERRDVTPLTRLLWFVMEASYHARVAHGVGCRAAVEEGLALARACGIRGLDHLLAMQGVYGSLAAGDLVAAVRYYDAAGASLAPGQLLNGAHLHQLGAWIALCKGDVATAEERARRAHVLGQGSRADLAGVWTEHTLAHVLVERGEHAEAVALLERCVAWTRRTGNPLIEHHCLLSLAYARLAAGRGPDALPFLREGMRLGREQGYVVHPWIGWRKDVMARLAALALEHGIEVEHVRASIRALGLAPPADGPGRDRWPWPLRVHALGGLEILRDGARVEFAPKAPRKPLELLRLLVAHGERGASLERLAEALWPDADGDIAHHALETTMYRLRRLLGDPGAVVRQGGRAALDPERVFVDAWAFDDLASRTEAFIRTADAPGALRMSAAAIDLYRGDLLPDDDLPAIASERDRLRSRIELLATIRRR